MRGAGHRGHEGIGGTEGIGTLLKCQNAWRRDIIVLELCKTRTRKMEINISKKKEADKAALL